MRKIILSIFTLVLLMTSCSKEENTTKYATDNVIPEGWYTEDQTVVINKKPYNITVAGDPNGDDIKFLNEPIEVDAFFLEFEETFVPHVILKDNQKIVYYYKSYKELLEHVEFPSTEQTHEKSLNGARVTTFQHSSQYYSCCGYQGSGNHLYNTNDYYSNYWWNSRTGVVNSAYGKRYCYVGSTMNDEISLVKFQLIQDDPITWVGYLDAIGSYGECNIYATWLHSSSNVKKIITITKERAQQTNLGLSTTNSAALFAVKRKSWNDCVSGYHFFQTTNFQLSNNYIP